jgi:hypothetical protein
MRHAVLWTTYRRSWNLLYVLNPQVICDVMRPRRSFIGWHIDHQSCGCMILWLLYIYYNIDVCSTMVIGYIMGGSPSQSCPYYKAHTRHAGTSYTWFHRGIDSGNGMDIRNCCLPHRKSASHKQFLSTRRELLTQHFRALKKQLLETGVPPNNPVLSSVSKNQFPVS